MSVIFLPLTTTTTDLRFSSDMVKSSISATIVVSSPSTVTFLLKSTSSVANSSILGSS